jgi:hypothetical protein
MPTQSAYRRQKPGLNGLGTLALSFIVLVGRSWLDASPHP